MDILEWFKEFDINNVWIVMVVSMGAIYISSYYIQLLNASKIEIVLMGKGDEAKRFGSVYIVLFFLLGIVNYIFTTSNEFISVAILFWILTMGALGILRLLKRKGKFKKWYCWVDERKDLIISITSTSIVTFFASEALGISLMSCVILGTLLEVIIIAMLSVNIGNQTTCITLEIEGTKWYVFKRLDSNYLLCGNKNNICDSTRTRLLDLDTLIKENVCFINENIAKD